MSKSFDTLLVANRGEIACRILKSAKSLGFTTVAVFSEADRHARHVRLADKAVCLGPAAATESYLRIDKIIEAAQKSGAGAIHPGYGFLSENTEFVKACDDASIVFVGPPVPAMQAMGKKREAKEIMRKAGVPVVPGTEGAVLDEDALVKAAESIGAPLMVKASAGGGGRGMRLVTDIKEVRESIRLAKAEAENAFGDGEIILERAVLNARHVEIQVFADAHGNCIHLGERDCSVQRRHQKVIEEAPSPAVDEALRSKMGQAAVTAAVAIGYVGAGTVEFLLEDSGEFYFMEMNTRLQVEHPVTEMVTGLDLVQMQLDAALGQPLPLSQADVTMSGHAMEVRLYAEDPWAGFLPQTGVAHLHTTELEGVRIDHGLDEGQEVTPHYDAMVAKIIVHGRDRPEALRKMRAALSRYALHGVTHNQSFLDFVLTQKTFVEGNADTKFVERELEETMKTRPPLSDEMRVLAAAIMAGGGEGHSPWRSNGPALVPLAFLERGERVKAHVEFNKGDAHVTLGDKSAVVTSLHTRDGFVIYTYDNVQKRARVSQAGKDVYVQCGAQVERFERAPLSEKDGAQMSSGHAVLAPMAGLIVDVRVAAGDAVTKNQVVAVLEAMKMQLELKAPREGKIEAVSAKVGEQLNARDIVAALVREDA